MPERGYPAGGPAITGDLLPAVPSGPAPGAMASTPVVRLEGVQEGLVVGPDEVAIIVLPATWGQEEWALRIRSLLLDAGLKPGQFAIIAGDGIKLAKVGTGYWRVLLGLVLASAFDLGPYRGLPRRGEARSTRRESPRAARLPR